MKKKRKTPTVLVVLPVILAVLLAVGVILAIVVVNRTSPSGQQAQAQGSSQTEASASKSESEPEPETESVPAVPKEEMLHFVDAHDNWYDVAVNPDVEKHPYDLSKFSNDGTVCTYEDDRYTSRSGIDVSSHQGDVDWNAVADAGIEFAFLRIGYRGYGEEGTLMLDDWFDSNITEAQEAGLDVGVYFFSQAVNEEEAVTEAELVLDALKPYELQLPVVFDAENILDDDARTDDVTGEQFTRNAIAFLNRIEKEGIYDTAIYSNMKWEAFTYDLPQLSDYPIWYADYEKLPQTPYQFTWWQYSEKGHVDGVDDIVDLNVELVEK